MKSGFHALTSATRSGTLSLMASPLSSSGAARTRISKAMRLERSFRASTARREFDSLRLYRTASLLKGRYCAIAFNCASSGTRKNDPVIFRREVWASVTSPEPIGCDTLAKTAGIPVMCFSGSTSASLPRMASETPVPHV